MRRNLGTSGSRITACLFGGYFGEQTHADQLTVGRVQPVLTVKRFDEVPCSSEIIEYRLVPQKKRRKTEKGRKGIRNIIKKKDSDQLQ